MTQSIITRYHGATNTKGSRISARTSGGKRVHFFPYDHGINSDKNQELAAWAVAHDLAWKGQWQGAALDEKGGMVWVNTSDSFAPNYRFEVKP
jgi:hypothetical protein